jgi:hypothetical protein
MEQGLLGRALVGADEGAQGLRDGEGHQEVRPGELFLQVMLEPLLGFLLLALGTRAVATGMLAAVLSPTPYSGATAVKMSRRAVMAAAQA